MGRNCRYRRILKIIGPSISARQGILKVAYARKALANSAFVGWLRGSAAETIVCFSFNSPDRLMR
ncbi:hypothetical protein [Rhizobium laguerreae]|uniref:hypothetical protein n=1 Tax=Rhizobium laguerreae TaxID=1076926 RepID=UPI001C9229EF|nr:hypothetical protein [Rhizobium laguerreae]MBY3349110.1 hypothetical protein [Rhizobium laguerreae]MBY3356170.1 hypothetical protein [Rhizobium laguerreae]MBY3370269.1 hypothetical protein [Rhizobium laguerreae]MBY3377253.1 hypothetical protein [Rhizobium laguerreae]MBY3391081.1 hypothetical protein [Rhizobium laguerreae]